MTQAKRIIIPSNSRPSLILEVVGVDLQFLPSIPARLVNDNVDRTGVDWVRALLVSSSVAAFDALLEDDLSIDAIKAISEALDEHYTGGRPLGSAQS